MAKPRTRNDTRSHIAHLAARLMAEDGIEDYALAKRKAARQAGVPDSRHLPTNEEIDAALKAYQQLYQQDEHRSRLLELRREALHVMEELARFNPYLTGSVLSGNAGKYADIDLQLYTDNVKLVELYLIDRGIPYRTAQSKLFCGESPRTVPTFTLNIGGADIQLLVLGPDDLRAPLKTSLEGKPLERAKIQAVADLLSRT